MAGIIQFRMFYLSNCHLQTKRLKREKLYEVIILVLYGRDIPFPTLREEYRLRVSENKVLRRLYGIKIKEGRKKEKAEETA
jgi:hypothetical protein